jgi:hypothetical protein
MSNRALEEEGDADAEARYLASHTSPDDPVNKLINAIVLSALGREGTHIRWEVLEHDLVVSFRVKGKWEEAMRPPRKLRVPMLWELKRRCGMEAGHHGLSVEEQMILLQHGAGKEHSYFCSFLPSLHGTWMLLRQCPLEDWRRVGQAAPVGWQSLYDRGMLAFREERYGDAEQLLRDALARAPSDLQGAGWTVSWTLTALSRVAQQQHRFAEARAYLEQLRDWSQPPNHFRYLVGAHLELAELAFAEGRPLEVMAEQQRALDLLAERDAKRLERLLILSDLGWAQHRAGDFARARAHHVQILEGWTELLGEREHPIHLHTLLTLSDLASAELALGEHASARKRWYESLSLIEQMLGPTAEELSYVLLGLAESLRLEQPAEAERLARRGLSLVERHHGRTEPLSAIASLNLAHTLLVQNRPSEAEPLIERAANVFQKKMVANHPRQLHVLSAQSELFAAQGRRAEAEQLLRDTLARFKSALGEKHPDLSWARARLASWAAEANRLDEATTWAEQARTGWASLPKGDPMAQQARSAAARALRAAGRTQLAEQLEAMDRPNLSDSKPRE